MKEWGDKLDLLAKMAQARHDARESVPKSGGNDAIEAAMFVAQWKAIREFLLQRVEATRKAASDADTAAASGEKPLALPPPGEKGVEGEQLSLERPKSEQANPEQDKPDPLAGLGGPFPTELNSDELLPEVKYDQ